MFKQESSALTQQVNVRTTLIRRLDRTLLNKIALLPQMPPKVATKPRVETIPKAATVLQPVAMERDNRMEQAIKPNPVMQHSNQLKITPDQHSHSQTELMHPMEPKERTVVNLKDNRMALPTLPTLLKVNSPHRTILVHRMAQHLSRMELKVNNKMGLDLIQLNLSKINQALTQPTDLLNREELNKHKISNSLQLMHPLFLKNILPRLHLHIMKSNKHLQIPHQLMLRF